MGLRKKPSVKNANVLYTGKVGAKMRPRPHVIRKVKPKRVGVRLEGGPYSGRVVRFDEHAHPGTTLPIQVTTRKAKVAGTGIEVNEVVHWVGRYVAGAWEPLLD